MEALPGLPPELTAGDLVAQQLRRCEAVPELLGEVLGDREADVEPDDVGELQRPR
jgi:hypothetical protein